MRGDLEASVAALAEEATMSCSRTNPGDAQGQLTQNDGGRASRLMDGDLSVRVAGLAIINAILLAFPRNHESTPWPS